MREAAKPSDEHPDVGGGVATVQQALQGSAERDGPEVFRSPDGGSASAYPGTAAERSGVQPDQSFRHNTKRILLPQVIGRLLHKFAFVLPGGGSLRPWLHRSRGVRIGKHVWISQMVYIDELHPGDVEIGDNCTIGYRSSIFTHFYWGRRRPISSGRVVIERDVFIGPHCVILPNVRIGEGAVIRAGTVVSRNVPPHAIWGLPAADLLGVATVPLTPEHSYEEFTRGMRPASWLRRAGNTDTQRS